MNVRWDWLDEVLTEIGAAKNLEELFVTLAKIRAKFGLANIVYHAVNIPGCAIRNPILLPTYDPAWVARYLERDYFAIDPIVTLGRTGFLPLDWSEIDRGSEQVRQFFREAERFGVGRRGVTIPVRGPGGERSLVTVTSNASEREWESNRVQHMREFQLIAHYLHDAAMRRSGLRMVEAMPTLSRREQECLQGISHGLTPKQIAAQLGVSITAIQLYLQSAKHKLGCTTTAQAVARAVILELIEH